MTPEPTAAGTHAAGPAHAADLTNVAGRADRDQGSAMIEFVGLSIVLLIPFVYLFLAVFAVQRSAFGVTQAAREAGRAFATSQSETAGLERARLAAQLAFTDQGIDGAPEVRFAPQGADCGAGNPGDGAATLEPGARFVVCVRAHVDLPGVGAVAGGLADVTVNGQFTVVIDAYRADRSGA
ncbi:conserved hypothetical protein [Parafrankia sp. Ea1.12]|nr:conserved hypothetical protein [Parafrankia sp. Ea1.12]